MKYACTSDGEKIEAVKGVAALCPTCLATVVPKCGRIKVHHWAHESGADCDCWYEPETEWHRAWKAKFPKHHVEVPIGPHRADIRVGKLVIELQNSPISPEEIQERERFYGNMLWLVNADRFHQRLYLTRLMGGGIFAIRWKHMSQSWRYAKRPVYFDLGSRSIETLLAASTAVFGVAHKAWGEFDPFCKVNVERYSGPVTREKALKGYGADPQFESLSQEVLSCTILRRHTLYENGIGSAAPVDMAEFLKLCRL